MYRVGLATAEQWPLLTADDQPLLQELASAGIAATPAVWSDASIVWQDFDLVIIRSCWDYYLRPEEFLGWIDRLDDEEVDVANNPSIIRWNAHKSYLLELGSRGVRIPATRVLPKGSRTPNVERGKLVVKPAVSASAFETHLFTEESDDVVAVLERLLRDGDVIVQQFVPEVVSDGEWSLVYFDRQLSHSVKKAPKAGDFRVQVEHGGSAKAAEAPARVVLEAEKALSKVAGDLLYARVDLVERPSGSMLMELELIEPVLFLGTAAGAARRFALAVRKHIASWME